MRYVLNCMFSLCRKKFVETLKEKFAHLGLRYSIGGQISFDVFPEVSTTKSGTQNSCVWGHCGHDNYVPVYALRTGMLEAF